MYFWKNILVVCLAFSFAAAAFGDGKIRFSEEDLSLPGKKGACFTLREPGAKKGGTWDKNMRKVKALDVYWNYSWGATLVPVQPKDIEFVPMIWGGSRPERLRDAIQQKVIPAIKSGRTRRLLGFNEPDHKKQSGISYMQAIELWPILESAGVPLCSPACANTEGINDPSAQGVKGTWMRDFIAEADKRGYRVDYIGTHWYGGTSVKHFKAQMKRIYEKYGKRPLLITEFAPADWKAESVEANRHTPAEVLAFMKEVLPWLESQDWIAGYAWFSFGIDKPQGASSALFDNDGNLTACGHYYKSVTKENPEGDQNIEPDPPEK